MLPTRRLFDFRLPPADPRLAAWSLLLATPNAQQQIVELGAGLRFFSRPGELWGSVQSFDADSGQWQDQRVAPGYSDGMGRFTVLPDEQVRNLQRPTTTPVPPPVPSSPPPTLGVPEQYETTRGYTAEPPTGPVIETLPPAPPVTLDDLIMNSANSRALGNNLTGVGEFKPASGYQPHHIVPIDDPRAANLRAQLARAGITDLNQAVNGVWLPANSSVQGNGETPHSETFRDSYFDYLQRRLLGASNSADIETRLARIKDDLKNGRQDFPLK